MNPGFAHEAAVRKFDFSPWSFWSKASQQLRDEQLRLQAGWQELNPEWRLGERCFLATTASIDCDALVLGDRSYVAAHAYLTGAITTGRDCTVNAFAVIRGPVRMGDAVRIGAHTSIIGFNHGFDEVAVEVFRQASTSKGVVIGNDVWIGSQVTILDGVTIGDGAVIAAAAVVTKDVAPGMVVAGNPARPVRRRGRPRQSGTHEVLRRVAAGMTEQVPRLLGERVTPDGLASDAEGRPVTVRAICDAIELGSLLPEWPTDIPWAVMSRRIAEGQDADSGLVQQAAVIGGEAEIAVLRDLSKPSWLSYQTMAAGYALRVLGQRLPHLIAEAQFAPVELDELLRSLPWKRNPWSASRIDEIGTMMAWNRVDHDAADRGFDQLIGWLVAAADPDTGMWGSSRDLRLLVNGYYRASRGTLAQAALPIPYPERVVDTVLTHAGTPEITSLARFDACTILDIVHPLWLASQQSAHRRAEITTVAQWVIATAGRRWEELGGFTFDLSPGPTLFEESLQGWEMWLSILWYAADLIESADQLGYRPQGIHRPTSIRHRDPQLAALRADLRG